jgi:hypothetical protein
VSEPHIRAIRFDHRGGTYHNVTIDCGLPAYDRIVPPAGEDHAFDYPTYPNTVEVAVSPTGRSVRVWLNGKKMTVEP